MSTPEERIKALARERAISPAEAERLLEAVRPRVVRVESRWNPFECWSGERAAMVGVVVAIVAILSSRVGVRTDGALDMHAVAGVPSFTTALVDQLVAYPLTALVFWAFARRARFVDILGVIGLARAAIVVVALPLALLAPHGHPLTGPKMAIVAIVAAAGVGIHILLLVLGFRTASGHRGARLAFSFLGALFVAELLSKIVLHFV